jgi:hypothetical protein
LPYNSCGFYRTLPLAIGTIGTFYLNVEDYKVNIGQEGSKGLTMKIGSFTDSINTKRVEWQIELANVPRLTYEAIKSFTESDLLNQYLLNYTGSISLNLGGESTTTGTIKSVVPNGPSVFFPATSGNPIDPDLEFLESVTLTILDSEYRLV